jgi:hypothetical protein
MKRKSVKIVYWILTLLFALMMFLDGLAGAFRVAGATEALAYLGYPAYLSTILGIAKIMGSAALLQPVFYAVKEWAYAGFTFIFTGAFASHFFAGSGFGFLILPLIMLAIMFLSYFLWRKLESEEL